jgi:hypothetical protein
MQVTVCGKRWKLQFVQLKINRGDCSSPNDVRKVIRVHAGLQGRERLEVLLHELMHAADWRAAEEHIEQSAADIARVLWRVGYRMNDDE